MIDLEGYQKTIIYGSCPGCNSIYSRMVMYTENMEFICSQKLDGYYEVPLNARYMRLSVYSGAGKTVTVISTKENLWDQLAIQEGAYPSGVYNPGDTNSCHIRIPVEEGALATVGAWGYACMDSSDAVLNYKTTHTGVPEGIPISEGVVCVAVCTNDANVGQITFCGWLKPIAYGTIQ
jgi:hypothetical protein